MPQQGSSQQIQDTGDSTGPVTRCLQSVSDSWGGGKEEVRGSKGKGEKEGKRRIQSPSKLCTNSNKQVSFNMQSPILEYFSDEVRSRDCFKRTYRERKG